MTHHDKLHLASRTQRTTAIHHHHHHHNHHHPQHDPHLYEPGVSAIHNHNVDSHQDSRGVTSSILPVSPKPLKDARVCMERRSLTKKLASSVKE